ncbi:hypothetical protein H2202_011193 [Exophiala xenobiotica]|nr:hypothetical protein H2202_011193 [Exophiala xenobiotica]
MLKGRSISIWSHLAINILSSALFAASNNCMQYLTAPSRTEIDEAHRRRRRLDIGVHTVRNLRSISRGRVALYNSAVFEPTRASSYTVLTASTEFINGGYWDSNPAQCSVAYNTGVDGLNVHPAIHYLQDNVDSLVRLDNAACIKAYRQEFQGKYGNVILVTNVSSPEPILNLVWDQFDTEPTPVGSVLKAVLPTITL